MLAWLILNICIGLMIYMHVFHFNFSFLLGSTCNNYLVFKANHTSHPDNIVIICIHLFFHFKSLYILRAITCNEVHFSNVDCHGKSGLDIIVNHYICYGYEIQSWHFVILKIRTVFVSDSIFSITRSDSRFPIIRVNNIMQIEH